MKIMFADERSTITYDVEETMERRGAKYRQLRELIFDGTCNKMELEYILDSLKEEVNDKSSNVFLTRNK